MKKSKSKSKKMKKVYFKLIFLFALLIFLSFITMYLIGDMSWFSRAFGRLGVFPLGTTEPTLVCDRDKIFIRGENNCTIINCNEGEWNITNLENNSLSSPITREIDEENPSSFSISFGPTLEAGKILTKVECFDPTHIILFHETVVISRPYLECSEMCLAGEDCECKVGECDFGLLTLQNYENSPLVYTIIEEVNGTLVNDIFNYTFVARRGGKVKAMMLCDEPSVRDQVIIIKINSTEEEVEEFNILSIACSGTSCSVEIDKNMKMEEVVVYVQLFEEPRGTIYYKGEGTVDPGLVDKITIPITKVKFCPTGTDLKVLALAYLSGQRIDRLTGSHIC